MLARDRRRAWRAAFLFRASAGVRIDWRVAAAELAVLFGADDAGHRAAVGAQGVGRVVGVGRAPHLGLMIWLIFVAYLLLRRYGGPGSDKLAAGLALFGMANVPFIYVSVNFWRTLHPKTSVVPTSLVPRWRGPLWFCVAAFLLLFLVLFSCGRSSSSSGGGSTRSTWLTTRRDAIIAVCAS